MSLGLIPPTTDLQPRSRFRLHSQAIVNGKESGEHPATWNSTDTSVAVVTDEGEVIALSAGFCDIVATNQFGEARAAIRVTDTPVEIESPIVAVITPSPSTAPETPTPTPTAAPAPAPAPAEASMPTPLPMPTLTPIPTLDVRRVQVIVTPDRVTLEGGDDYRKRRRKLCIRSGHGDDLGQDNAIPRGAESGRIGIGAGRGTAGAVGSGRSDCAGLGIATCDALEHQLWCC